MAELFIELFTEEIPSNLQINARKNLLSDFRDFFESQNVKFKGKNEAYSTPNRLVIYFENIDIEVVKKSKEVRGPNINAPENALDGFLKSNQISKKNIFKNSS